MRKEARILLILLLSAIVISFYSPVHVIAQHTNNNENPFFSYKRFYAQLDILTNTAEGENIRSDIKAFMRNFADGIRSISAGDTERAKIKLLRAVSIWPEYFGTYFLLARVNEDTGKYKLSAQFYKSYLNKLKAFSEGNYRISGPLMIGITPYNIENYDDAYALAKERLRAHGIDLATVRPYYVMTSFYRLLIAIIVLGAGYTIAVYGIIPYVKRWQHIHNPPQGYWVCTKCGTCNLTIRIECEKCGKRINEKEFRGHNT